MDYSIDIAVAVFHLLFFNSSLACPWANELVEASGMDQRAISSDLGRLEEQLGQT